MKQWEADHLAREALTPRQLRLREERGEAMLKRFMLMIGQENEFYKALEEKFKCTKS